jgi:hypothetical protein
VDLLVLDLLFAIAALYTTSLELKTPNVLLRSQHTPVLRIHACHVRRRIHACHMRRRIHACG